MVLPAEPALFLPDEDGFVGTRLIQGGWHPDQANGGAVLALLGHCLDDVPTLVPMAVSRFTVDLMRPIPIGRRLTVRSTIEREGKKIQIVVLRLFADEVELVRATALRLRIAPVVTPDLPPSTIHAFPADRLVPPDEMPRTSAFDSGLAGFLDGIDLRRAPTVDGARVGNWVRLLVPVVAGAPIRTTARLTSALDFATLIGISTHPGTVTMINPDVTGQVLRPPVGEWIAITGDTVFEPTMGRGVSRATLSDDEGAFAIVSVSQLLQFRD